MRRTAVKWATRAGRTVWDAVTRRAYALVRALRGPRAETGMVTSEYAVGIVAAVAFAAVLYKVVTSGQVSAELQGIVKKALDVHM